MEASRIMPRYYQFFIVLSLLCILGLCHAIYDPSATTVKPPKHREPVLPWYLSGKEYPDKAEDQNPQRSLKWPVDPDEPRQPLIIHAETQTWSPWRKPSESEIEQRTEISPNRQNKDTEQKQDWFLEYDQFDQNGNGKPSQKPSGSLNFGPKQELRPNSYDKSSGTHGQDPKLQFGRGNSADFYEGLAADNLKSHKEEILQPPRPKLTVAQYDVHRGVVCPETDSTGQFVYPPDCKFFVNCWKGRAFVQPCAPGTLFNPETLECDFPHKVKCYGGEIADFPSRDHSDYTGRREPLSSESQLHSDYSKLQSLPPAPRCPPHVTGLLPHPTDCTKFLQCANGGGHIMDCGPGTVFNPAISVCDWPRNVRGCENAYKSNEGQDKPLVPPHHHDNARSEYNKLANQKKIACPSDYTGLLPHPETCKKFLQCANGVTYIMDCGPGTAFNPLTSVCDWPYNVPGCSEDKPVSNQVPPTTTASPWFTRGPTGPPSWQNPYFTNHTIRGTYIPNVTWPSMPPSAAIPSTTPGTVHNPNDSRPKWIPTPRPQTWKPGTPNYHPGHHEHNGHDSNHHREYDYREHGTPHYPSYPSPHDHRTNAPETHPHHHYHPQHNHHPQRPIYNPNENRESGYPISYDQNQGHHDNYPEETTHGTTYPHPGHPPYSHTAPYSPGQPGFSDQTQSRYPESKFEGNQFGRPANHIGIPESNLPPNRRTGYELTPNRQEYGRNIPGYHPGINLSPRPDGNVYAGNNYDPEGRELIGGVWNSATNQTQLLWSSRNKTGRPEVPSNGPGVVPGNWNHPYGQGQSTTDPPPRSWNQGGTNHDDKLHQWDSGSNVYQQSTSDNENDRKFDQWALKTNIFPNKGLVRPGMEDSLTNATKPHYPSTLYVTINGTRAHFITKNPEVNQGHSNTRSYGVHESAIPDRSNNGSTDVRPGSDRTNRGFNFSNGRPATDLEAPFPSPANTSYGPAVNLTGIKPDQLPTYHWINRPFPPPQPADLVGTESVGTSHVVAPPMQPPSYYGHNYNESLKNNYYPPNVPSSNLQPPHYAPANGVNYYYPNVPGSELEPPHPEGQNNQSRFGPYPPVPATNLQPPSYRPPRPWFTPSNGSSQSNTDVQYPSIPSSDLQPPYHQSPTPSKNGTHYPEKPSRNLQPPFSESSNSTMSKPNGTVGNNYPEVRVKKKILQTGKPKLPGIVRTTSDPNLPSVSIEGEDDSNEAENGKFSNETPDVVEPDLDVDVLDDKQVWKPVLVFENKTKTTTTTETSVIMKIGKKKLDLDLFNIEAAPFHQDEPPFPTYFIPPVQPLSHSNKVALPTPISGQVIRLRGGPGPYEGYVEVQGVNPGWGIVCDTRNSWTLKEAHIVCKQLGYIRGAEMAWQGRNTKNGVPSWIAANTVTCYGNETRFQSCKFTHQAECRIERDAIGVRCMPNRVAHCHKDEIPHDGQCYHLADPESGLNHAEALEYCTNRQSRLIDITNQLENDFISEWLLQKHPEVGSVMTSGVGFTTLNRTIWLWEDSSRAKFRFAKWWPGWKDEKKLPPVIPSGPGCVVMKRKFPCYDRPNSICVADYFFWDAEDCSASVKGHAYICKRPYDDIGCTYGKGSQYTGTANVTSSGKPCLPWADPKVAHPLVVNVVSREMREKLKAHNYCRNPNPNKESRPWCFASPNGQREYCDIPPCGNIASKRALVTNQCKPKHFECLPGECIPSPWVCDGEEDCTNGADEKDCRSHLNLFQKSARQKLEGYDVEKWMNTPLKTCALRCKEADFTCRSFSHKADGNVCFLSDSNIGMTGGLKPNKEYDYYEMKERSMNCEGMYVCENRKCINQTEVCNGKNDCFDRSDESICTVENLDYDIRLAGSNETHEGRVEVKILGFWGQVCDDGFGMINAEVICKELGFPLGALEVRPGGFYGNLDPPSRFMVDQLKCRGNEKSLRECDFDGWGVHNCQPEEAVGIVCKTAVNSCQEGHWKCDNSPVCIPTSFICDEVVDCPDGSDESPSHCNAPFEIRLANGSSPLQGRVEVRHHGVWGTVCDDDFSSVTAAVICRSLGYGGPAIAKKDGFFGPGEGPIWLDEVFCHGNESQLNRCEHNQWGQNNCDHNEDAGVICSPGDVNDSELWEAVPHLPEPNINHLLPANCGKRPKDFNDDEDNIFAKVVHGTIAPKGTYPWQASIRVRGHSRSSHWCGAVMLSPVHVLTAAHCLEGYNKGTYFVRAGDYNTEIDEGTEMEANIEDYYIHEDFRKGHRMNNDIALVLLKGRGIPLGKDIMPICLPHENTEYPPGLNCTISGFGSIETGKSAHSKDLRYGWIPLLDQSVCKADYIYGEGAISDGMVCAGYLDEGVDTCEGDSGGPLACYHNGAFTLYGITSWGQHCGKANKPGVYVRVSYYRRWIDQKIKESLGGR